MVSGSPPPARTAVPRCVFVEEWWLDAASAGAWGAVSVESDGHRQGWLPFGTARAMGFSRCGTPPLTRLLFPVLDLSVPKDETLQRARFQIETDLIDRLPPAASYEFILPPHQGNALSWQARGFDARVQHTFVFDPGEASSVLWGRLRNKTRNVIRRATDSLDVRPLSVDEFIREYGANLNGAVDAGHLAAARRIVDAATARGQGQAVGAVDGDGRVHAAVVFVWDATDYYYYLSTRDREHAALGAVSLLVWRGIEEAMTRQLRFDFDGVSSVSRLRFLQSFGGRLASRIVVSRGSAAFEARMLLRRIRRRLTVRGPTERFY